MRIELFLLLSAAVALGCSNDDSGAGGTGGTVGDGGTGGGQGSSGRAFILYTPIPPCVEGTPSMYRLDIIGDRDIVAGLMGSSDQCESFTFTGSSESFECDNDGPSIPYTLVLDDGEEATSGTFATCEGFFTIAGPLQAPPSRLPFLDLFIVPNAPCAVGVESTYRVQALVDSVPAAVENVRLELAGCAGSLDQASNTFTCTNSDETLEYMLVANPDGSTVTINGIVETCSSVIFADLQ